MTELHATVSYGGRIEMLAREAPDEVALLFIARSGATTSLTRGELAARSNGVAQLFAHAGLKRGSALGIGLPNSVEHVLCAIAAWKLGAYPIPLRYDLPDWERDELLGLAKPALLVADWSLKNLRTIDREALRAGAGIDAATPPDVVPEPRFAICSGGSTGRLKLIVDARPAAIDLETFGDPFLAAMGWTPGRTHLIAGPLYHANGFSLVHLALLIGQRTILLERFDAAQVAAVIEQYDVHCGTLVPTMMFRLARLPGIEQRDFSSLVSIYHGGAACAPWLKREWINLIGAEKLYEGFGSTEAVGETLIRGDEWLEHPGSVGRGEYCDIKILDAERNPVEPGTVGEIFMRWKTASRPTYRYVGQQQAETTADGFASVGDLGWLDEQGYLYIADRRTDMIISGGANIYPTEVEAALLEHRGLADAAVIGLPDEEWGKRVHAIVVAADLNDPPSQSELDRHCRSLIARYKVPKSYEYVAALPRNEVGKIRKIDLVSSRVRGAFPAATSANPRVAP